MADDYDEVDYGDDVISLPPEDDRADDFPQDDSPLATRDDGVVTLDVGLFTATTVAGEAHSAVSSSDVRLKEENEIPKGSGGGTVTSTEVSALGPSEALATNGVSAAVQPTTSSAATSLDSVAIATTNHLLESAEATNGRTSSEPTVGEAATRSDDSLAVTAKGTDAAIQLPPDWETRTSKSRGMTYYYNTKTQQSAWEIPGPSTPTSAAVPGPKPSPEATKITVSPKTSNGRDEAEKPKGLSNGATETSRPEARRNGADHYSPPRRMDPPLRGRSRSPPPRRGAPLAPAHGPPPRGRRGPSPLRRGGSPPPPIRPRGLPPRERSLPPRRPRSASPPPRGRPRADSPTPRRSPPPPPRAGPVPTLSSSASKRPRSPSPILSRKDRDFREPPSKRPRDASPGRRPMSALDAPNRDSLNGMKIDSRPAPPPVARDERRDERGRSPPMGPRDHGPPPPSAPRLDARNRSDFGRPRSPPPRGGPSFGPDQSAPIPPPLGRSSSNATPLGRARSPSRQAPPEPPRPQAPEPPRTLVPERVSSQPGPPTDVRDRRLVDNGGDRYRDREPPQQPMMRPRRSEFEDRQEPIRSARVWGAGVKTTSEVPSAPSSQGVRPPVESPRDERRAPPSQAADYRERPRGLPPRENERARDDRMSSNHPQSGYPPHAAYPRKDTYIPTDDNREARDDRRPPYDSRDAQPPAASDTRHSQARSAPPVRHDLGIVTEASSYRPVYDDDLKVRQAAYQKRRDERAQVGPPNQEQPRNMYPDRPPQRPENDQRRGDEVHVRDYGGPASGMSGGMRDEPREPANRNLPDRRPGQSAPAAQPTDSYQHRAPYDRPLAERYDAREPVDRGLPPHLDSHHGPRPVDDRPRGPPPLTTNGPLAPGHRSAPPGRDRRYDSYRPDDRDDGPRRDPGRFADGPPPPRDVDLRDRPYEDREPSRPPPERRDDFRPQPPSRSPIEPLARYPAPTSYDRPPDNRDQNDRRTSLRVDIPEDPKPSSQPLTAPPKFNRPPPTRRDEPSPPCARSYDGPPPRSRSPPPSAGAPPGRRPLIRREGVVTGPPSHAVNGRPSDRGDAYDAPPRSAAPPSPPRDSRDRLPPLDRRSRSPPRREPVAPPSLLQRISTGGAPQVPLAERIQPMPTVSSGIGPRDPLPPRDDKDFRDMRDRRDDEYDSYEDQRVGQKRRGRWPAGGRGKRRSEIGIDR